MRAAFTLAARRWPRRPPLAPRAAVVLLLAAGCAGTTDPLGLAALPPPAGAARRSAARTVSVVPVTCAEYALFVQETGAAVPAAPAALYRAWGLDDLLAEARAQRWDGPLPQATRLDHPVTMVPFVAAQAYCRWAGRARRRPGRLPTEDEWVAAAGGGDGRAYPWGDAYDPRRLNDATSGRGGTTPAGAFVEGASPLGVLDLAGNVSEWTATPGNTPYTRVVKGGSYASPPEASRIDAREILPEGMVHPRVGFRCVFE